jgi:hypothetical protein
MSHIKFYQNSFCGSEVVPHGRTARHDKANTHFCNFAYVPKNTHMHVQNPKSNKPV